MPDSSSPPVPPPDDRPAAGSPAAVAPDVVAGVKPDIDLSPIASPPEPAPAVVPPTAPPLSGEAAFTERVARVLAPTFDLDREVGRGGMGIVYRAVDRRLKRAVAVKVLPPDLAFRADIRSRFLQEAETAAQLSHPDIVPIFTVDERDGLVYFVMAYVDGQTLAQHLKAVGGRLPISEARRILREVGSALAYAHAHGVIHRDIKPDNILLSVDGGRVMVTDFGIARAVTATGDSRLTATGVAIGTPAYMSPEQCAGDREVDGRSDLYSLGVVGYQMLCGSLPFTGGSTASLLVKQLSEAPVPLRQRSPNVPDGLATTVMRLLAKDPAARYPDANAFLAALAADSAGPGLGSATAPSVDSATPRASTGGRSVGGGPPLADSWPLPLPPPPSFAALPPAPDDTFTGRAQRRLSKRDQRKADRAARHGEILESDPRLTKIRKFRGMAISYAGTMAFLSAINLVTSPHFFWAIFPMLGMGLALHKAAGRLWADGIGMRDVFGKQAREALARGVLPATAGAPPGSIAGLGPAAAALAPAAVLAGPYGAAVVRAALDRDRIRELVSHLDRRDLTLVPNAAPTADGLADQVGALAGALHRIDVETPPEQRPVLADRRAALAAQMDRASLLLQTLYLDLLRLRMSDATAGADGVAGVTEQASALSRDIGYALGAADELRALDGDYRKRSTESH